MFHAINVRALHHDACQRLSSGKANQHAARIVDRDGFTTNLASSEKLDGLKYWTGRVGILFKPTDAINNYLMLFNTDELDSGTGLVGLAINSGRTNDKTGIAYNELGVKFLFNPGSTEFWSDPKISGAYAIRQGIERAVPEVTRRLLSR